VNHNVTQIYEWSSPVQSEQRLRSITFPHTKDSWNRLHIFGISLTPALLSPSSNSTKPLLAVRRVRSTTRWELLPQSHDRAQVLEITIANLLASTSSVIQSWLTTPHVVEIVSPLFDTVQAATIHRLAPSDEVRVEVLVVKKKNVQEGASGTANVEIRDHLGDLVGLSRHWSVSVMQTRWEESTSSLSLHETPKWVCASA